MATIYAYKNFNNYYNRKVKGQDIKTIEEFVEVFGDYDFIQTGTTDNFDVNDGVSTSHVLGRQSNPYEGDCDYLLVCKDNNNIDSKWFIIDQDKQCFGQFKLSLYRDVVADHWDNILRSDCFIERGIVPDDNPLIFNSEEVSSNQIKKAEYRLFDKTRTPWIVAYCDTSAFEQSVNITVPSENINYLTNYAELANTTAANPNKLLIRGKIKSQIRNTTGGNSYSGSGRWVTVMSDNQTIIDSESSVGSRFRVRSGYTFSEAADQWATLFASDSAMLGYIKTANGLTDTDFYNLYNGKIVRDNDTGKYYDITVRSVNASDDWKWAYTSDSGSSQYNEIGDAARTEMRAVDALTYDSQLVNTAVMFSSDYMSQYVILTERTILSTELTLTNTALKCKDAPYIIMGIPYDKTNLRLAIELKAKLSSKCYDMQISPYCPVQDYYTSAGEIDPSLTFTEHVDYEYINSTNGQTSTHIARCWFVPESNISFNLYKLTNEEGTILDIADILSIENVKMDNITKLHRFCSPNGNGAFDFNLAKNGSVGFVNVDITFRPLNPYFHLNPAFSGLYGSDFNDYRGLVLQGDFSIPLMSDKWQDYVTQNKNYENIFNREIQSMDVKNNLQLASGIVSALFGAGAAGMGAGAVLGPGAGIGLGALSALGGAADVVINQLAYAETKGAKIDIHNLQLQNIQALPRSVVSTGCLTYNNKLVPYIEVFDCTDAEKTFIANKIAWNSMNLGIIGKLEDYISNVWSFGDIEDKGFIKAKPIRLEGIEDDTHVVNAIADELYKGVYTK